jgi:Raf kinase inhibitor-like YbhB/YbcL family protein
MRKSLIITALLFQCTPSTPASDATTEGSVVTDAPADGGAERDVATPDVILDASQTDTAAPPIDAPTPSMDVSAPDGGPLVDATTDTALADSSPAADAGAPDAAARLTVTSTAFMANGSIPARHAFTGCGAGASNRSPALAWTGAPAGTRSFALILDDSDAPGGTFTHWLLYNIPGTSTMLPEGVAARDFPQARNDFGNLQYDGPCPPPPREHRYSFRVYALSVPTLDVPEGASAAAFASLLARHTIARGELVGRYRQ